MKGCIIITQLIIPRQASAWWSSSSSEEKYHFSQTRKETPQDFNDFLEACSVEERIQLLQALKDLPSLKDKYFGQLNGLPRLEHFTTDKNKITPNRPFKPSSFNEVLPETVLSAVRAGIINDEAISISEVRKALIWRAYNKTTYYFREDKEVNYHEIVQWAAKKSGVNSEQVNNLSTFALEAMWDNLDHNQRMAVLNRIEKETGVNLDKNSIATMGGAAALTALAVATKFVITSISWPVFVYSVMIIQTVAGWLGFTFTAGEIGIGLGTLIWTPVGWAIIAGIFGSSVVFMGSPEKETISTFIMTVNTIKAKRWSLN